MRFYTILCALLCFSFSSFGQIADGSIAPDFTVTDIEGNEHNLYDILGEGKTVILDLFATWCGPCWGYHNDHILADIYDEFGPDGTDEVMVLAIESDGGTNLDCLFGPTDCNNNTFGDWTEGVPYPIVNDNTVFRQYEAGYYPTIFTIFPNRQVYEMGQLQVGDVIQYLSSGPQLSPGVNPEFLEVDVAEGSYCESVNTQPHYLMINQGEENVTSADISVTINGTVEYEEAWVGDAAPWQLIADITLPSIEISQNSILEFRMDNINQDASNSVSHVSEIITNVTNKIKVEVTTDSNSTNDDTRFTILSMLGKTIASEKLTDPNTTYEFEYTLEDLICHVFIISDNAGNGVNGEVKVSDSQGKIIFNQADFGFGAETTFNASQNSGTIEVLQDVALNIAPNPVTDYINLNLDLGKSKNLSLTITNTAGQPVRTQQLRGLVVGHNNVSLDASDISSGLYFVTLQDETGSLTSRFVKM